MHYKYRGSLDHKLVSLESALVAPIRCSRLKEADVIEEPDIAQVKLIPSLTQRFSNRPCFQAITPRRLLEYSDIAMGHWFELDGMGAGLISLEKFVIRRRPPRPPGYPEIEFSEWA